MPHDDDQIQLQILSEVREIKRYVIGEPGLDGLITRMDRVERQQVDPKRVDWLEGRMNIVQWFGAAIGLGFITWLIDFFTGLISKGKP